MQIKIVKIKNLTKNITTKVKAFFELKRCSECSHCIGWWIPEKSRKVEDKFYCESCAKENFKICDCCDKIVSRLRDVEGKKICNECFIAKTGKCNDCGDRFFNNHLISHNFQDYCRDCYRNFNRTFHSINIGQKKEYSKSFNKNPDKRFCGIEIECLNRSLNKNSFIKKELKEFRFSQGTDYSLSEGGVEFRSVPMNGDLLFNSLESFGKALNEKCYRVNSTCGLHLHLEVKQELEYLKKLYLFYLRFEDMFFNMLPKSRRSRKFCTRFKKYYKDTPKQILAVETLDKFKEMLYETKYYAGEIRSHGNSKRYCWANLHSIFYRGTLEVRSHSGTVNPAKIINWIMIHQRVLKFLDEKSLEEIGTMKVTKKAFLEIFSRPLQNYIKRRWTTFILLEEKDLKARAPVYIGAMLLGLEDTQEVEDEDEDDDEEEDEEEDEEGDDWDDDDEGPLDL